MEKRLRQIMTICLAIAMLFSGMFFGRLKVTSYFAEANFPENPAVIRVAEPEAVVAHIQKEKEEYRSISNIMERKYEKESRTGSRVNQLLLLVVLLLSMIFLFVFLWEYQILGNAISFIFIIISYIHKKDGEKEKLA